ncbi:hypothetical protein [Propionivibrio sp.]|uniref:hypothetical protein n=1 Tax=Propionivibrio sp. TaxID=2212460 RepID=UPI003BF4297B
MNQLKLVADRLRLAADLWLHRHGPWCLLFVGMLGVLLGFALIVMPQLNAELATKQATLKNLQVLVASSQERSVPAVDSAAKSALHYQAFRENLADDEQVLPSIKAILDSAERHHLVSSRAEYLRAGDDHAQTEMLQMTVPVKGRYSDIRRWIEDILGTQAFVAVNELAFKREEISENQVEAKIRFTIWHHPASPAKRAGRIRASEVAP